jgi:serine/threonine-protein kinase
VLVYGADEIDGHVGVWMELIKGRTLDAVLRATGRLGAREAASIGRDLCGALAAIHGQDLVHGDIKAHNVMREDGGRIVLMDFGAGKDLRAGSPYQTTDFAGTPLYLAPEIFSGAQRAQATDIYALGVLLFHLVTDSYPVQGRTVDDVERAHARGERTHLRDVRPDLPDSFVSVVERALARDPTDRYQTAGAFESALARSPDQHAARRFLTPPRIITALVLAALVAGVVSTVLAGRFVQIADRGWRQDGSRVVSNRNRALPRPAGTTRSAPAG